MSAIPFLTRGLDPAPPLKAPLTAPLRGLRTRSSKACKLPAFPTPTPGAAVGSTSVVVARVLQRRQIGGIGASGGNGGNQNPIWSLAKKMNELMVSTPTLTKPWPKLIFLS